MQLGRGKNRISVRVHPISALFWVGILLLDRSEELLLSLLAAFLHEGGHLMAMRGCGIGITRLTVYPMGFDIHREEKISSYRSDFLIASAGVFTNLLFALLGAGILPLLGEGGRWMEIFIASNLLLSGVNLLPYPGLDGGEMLRTLLLFRFSPEGAGKAVRCLADGLLPILFCGVLYLLFYAKGNVTVYLFCAYLAVSLVRRGGGE